MTFIDGLGLEAFVRGEGGQGPALVYVPGIDGTGDFLLGTKERLETRFRLVRLGYRATGSAWRTDDPYAELAASVDRVVEELGIPHTLSLAESFGGAVSLAWALHAPERVRGLAIVNSFAHFSRRGSLKRTQWLAPFLPPGLFHLGRRVLGHALLFAPRKDAEAWERFMALGGTKFGPPYRSRLAMIGALDLRPRLAEIERPVFLYAADRDRVVASVHAGREMLALLPDARLTILEQAGHLVLPLAEEPWTERMLELQRAAEPTR